MVFTKEIKGLLHREAEPEDKYKNRVIKDYWICSVSREASLLARREVLTGKAKFGILGDGKEVPQVALAHFYQKGDWRSGYYRDQTLMMALDLCSVEDYFAQLYADTENDPFTGGRQMNSHYSTQLINNKNEWLDQSERYNISADVSSTGSQMARALGLAFTSGLYRKSNHLKNEKFSINGNEVCFCTIGDASTSEGVFWETVNAAVVLQVPLGICVWDDGYGISVPIELQTAKGSISQALSGMKSDDDPGLEIFTVYAWDYPSLCEVFDKATTLMRKKHTPCLIHVKECTQPQGHSTSGSHERYKSEERLEWEKTHDSLERMAAWMIKSEIASEEAIEEIRKKAKEYVKEAKQRAWNNYYSPIMEKREELKQIVRPLLKDRDLGDQVKEYFQELESAINPLLYELLAVARKIKAVAGANLDVSELTKWINNQFSTGRHRYHTHLYATGSGAAINVPGEPAQYSEDAPMVSGYEVLNRYFDKLLERDARVHAFGEDVGKIGDVNQGFANMQAKYGEDRVFDTGIREWTIIGQAIGMAMRGLRPIAEIQYLDYLIYAHSALSDDLATLRYRSAGTQQAPAIIRTRGHRLEGIWHAGSPLGMLISSLRGMYILCPRNMTQAAGFYNTMMESVDPALIIECLNGYRLKEKLPSNLETFKVPLGMPEVLQEGDDITVVTYGSCVRDAQRALSLLEQYDISVELIDVQTLLPFDLEERIVQSLKKTNRILFLDEDIPGGGTAYMMQKILEEQGGYRYLDSPPSTLTAHAHRPPYGSDGDYFSKPNSEDIFYKVYSLMREFNPQLFPNLD